MPRLVADPTTDELVAGFGRVRAEFGVADAFPAEVVAEAVAARVLVDARRDRTDLALVTIDPLGSRDLDQAFTAERQGSGYRVWYAVADVAVFVAPGGAVDEEAHARGVTVYSPDRRSPLYPEVLGEGAASLLPGDSHPVVLWRIDLDAEGRTAAVDVTRATVRSRAALSYDEVQAALDGGTADDPLRLLRDIGRRRQAIEEERGGISLTLPDQQIVGGPGGYQLAYRTPLPVEDWNAQISLLTGMEAARIMLAGGIGILRTLPPLRHDTRTAIRRSARTLGFEWPKRLGYAAFMRQVDRASPAGAALVHQAARAFRGAGYLALHGTSPKAHDVEHATVAAPYAHVTAPLRRLADRVANEIVLALAAGAEPPEWAVAALSELPRVMGQSQQRQHSVAAAQVDFMEAMVLRSRVGDVFTAVVTDVDDRGGVIQLREPAVLARIAPDGWSLGDEIEVRLRRADPDAREVLFERAAGSVAPDG